MDRSRRRWVIGGVILVLYLVTWIGGSIDYAASLKRNAQVIWERGKIDEAIEAKIAQKLGQLYRPWLYPDGPKTGIAWCVPILPGVLIADSYTVFGRNGGSGGIKVVLYYGFGSIEIATPLGWIS